MSRANFGPALLAVCLLFAGCGDGGAKPPPNPPIATPPGMAPSPPPLLVRAIAAMGGRERLSAVRTTESVAVVEDGPMRYRVRVQVLLPDAYRDEVETEEARFVRVWRDGKGFGALDGLPFELSAEETAALRDSLRLTSLSLLVDVDHAHGAEVKELAPKDGCERLEVRYAAEPKGPYELCFDAATARLKSVRFASTFIGRPGRLPARLELDDWRPVEGGVFGAFAAKLFIDDDVAPASVTKTESLAVNSTLVREAFDPPTGDAPILVRDLGPETVALWERKGPDGPAPADAEEKLAAFVSSRGLVRRGPVFRLLAAEESPPAVGVAVVPPRSETRPSATGADSLRVTTRPGGRVLTVAVRSGDEKILHAAATRLAKDAAERGYVAAGPCRVVSWSRELVQIQLPVRPR